MLRERLEEMGSFYGAFPAHDALWDSAAATAHSLPARLAIEHCTLGSDGQGFGNEGLPRGRSAAMQPVRQAEHQDICVGTFTVH